MYTCGPKGAGQSRRAASTIFRAPDHQRAADIDRQRALDQLRMHVGTGRLGLDEFEERVEEALGARTIAELAHTLRDLPRLRTEAELRSMRHQVVLPYLVVNAMLLGVWAITGFGFPWPIFPLVGWGLPVLDQWRRLRHREPPVTSTVR